MGKKKNSIALFEVISKSREKRQEPGLNVPQWMSHEGDADAQGASNAQGEQASSEPSPPKPPPMARQAARQGSQTASRPMAAVIDNRIHLSVNYLTCGVVVASLVILLVASFLIGRATVDTGPAELAGANPPTLPGTAQGAGGSGTAERVPGKWYLVIQNLRGSSPAHKETADKIVELCNKNGHPAEIRTRNGNYVIWAKGHGIGTPYAREGYSKAALDYAREIEEFGKEVVKELAADGLMRYDFRQRNRNGEFTPLYIQAKQTTNRNN